MNGCNQIIPNDFTLPYKSKILCNNNNKINTAHTKVKFENFKNYISHPFFLAVIEDTNILCIISSKNKHFLSYAINNLSSYIPHNHFLQDLAYCNRDKMEEGSLYVSGGVTNISNQSDTKLNKQKTYNNLENKNKIFNGKILHNSKSCSKITNNYKESKLFFRINILAETEEQLIEVLPSMRYPHSQHTMLSKEKYIFVVGGKNNNVVEFYDINQKLWGQLDNLNKTRIRPICFFHDNNLYIMFGKKNNKEHEKTCEVLKDIKIKKKFELFDVINPEEINLKYTCCGIFIHSKKVFFFGGKFVDEPTNTIMNYNIDENTITNEKKLFMKTKNYFIENRMKFFIPCLVNFGLDAVDSFWFDLEQFICECFRIDDDDKKSNATENKENKLKDEKKDEEISKDDVKIKKKNKVKKKKKE